MIGALDNLFPWFGDMLDLGGTILLVIIIMAALLWTLIIERLLFLHFGYTPVERQIRSLWEARNDRHSWYAQQFRNCLLGRLHRMLNNKLAVIRILVKICPLLGLLGTVLGMLDVFDAVAATGANNPRSTAAGVSKATITTMAGMVVALSGILVSSYLNRRAQNTYERVADQLEYSSENKR